MKPQADEQRKAKLPTDWPVVITKQGRTVKIYRVTRATGYPEFKLAYYAEGKRLFKTFADYSDALAAANTVKATLAKGDTQALTLTSQDRLAYLRAVDALKGLDVPLDVAAVHYADAKRRLGQHSLKDAVTFYLRTQAGTVEKPVSEVVAEFIRQKEQGTAGKKAASAVYVKDIRSRLGKFAEAMHCNISAAGPTELKMFLEGLGASGRTWFNHARLLRTLFKFAQRERCYPRGVDPFEGIEIAYDDDSEIEIFTPTEMSRLFTAARPEMVPFLAIGAFAGLRHAEIARLDWSDVKADHIEVKKSKAKTRSRRIVPIQPNLQAWLAPYRQQVGPVAPFANMSRQLLWLAEASKQEADEEAGTPALPQVDWRHNALRHSFISYRMAVLKDENAVALEAGNSPQMIFQNYRELVTESEAKTWFSICPKGAAQNVIQMPAASGQS